MCAVKGPGHGFLGSDHLKLASGDFRMPDHFIETVLHTSKIFIHVMAVILGNACWQALEEQPYANPVGLWTSLIDSGIFSGCDHFTIRSQDTCSGSYVLVDENYSSRNGHYQKQFRLQLPIWPCTSAKYFAIKDREIIPKILNPKPKTLNPKFQILNSRVSPTVGGPSHSEYH